jgi:hypothetical protein
MSDGLVKRYGRLISTAFDREGFDALHSISPQQRVLVYYLHRAAIAGYRITLFQMCPHPGVLDALYRLIQSHSADDDRELHDQLCAWWVYLFANFGVHCQRESENNKKVPSDMGLDRITPDVLRRLGVSLAEAEERYLFDRSYFPTATVHEKIEESGNAFYPPGYKQSMYAALTQDERDCLVAYHTPEGMKTYSTHGVCKEELTDVVKWLKLAMAWSNQFPDQIHPDIGKSLDLLIQHFETGDEKLFKEHSKVWLKLNNKVEYTFGFIEYYDDPMSHVGTFQADVTLKTRDISRLLVKLPSFEERFPFPPEYKRKDMSTVPNAAPANKIIGIGGLGPLFSTLAYCLPNYTDIRSEFGSKQVMYPSPLPSDVNRYMKIYYSEKHREIFRIYSPDLALERSVASLATTLHETIGHASGSMIEGVTEKVRNERLGKWGNGLEEMRAEILALYTAIQFYDEIVATGFLGDWPSKVPKEVIWELVLDDVAGGGWRRWRGLPSGTTAITQAHALADTGIMYYLIDHCPEHIRLVHETVQLSDNEEPLTVLRLRAFDIDKLLPVLEELANKVQHMSSTADAAMVNDFMTKYASSTRDPSYADIVTRMRDAQNHGVIETVHAFPEFDLVTFDGNVHDAVPRMPSDPLEHFKTIYELSRPGMA